MDTGLQLDPIPDGQRRAGVTDTALLFAGANVVTTTLVTGGALGLATDDRRALLALALGILVGTAPIAILARLGPRFGLPTMVLLRDVFGHRGADAVAGLLVLTNFAWIALNNALAASSLSGLFGGSFAAWQIAVAVLAIAVAAAGPIAMARFDRVAVPLLALIGAGITWKLFSIGGEITTSEAVTRATVEAPDLGLFLALDLVVGYQVSWSLMFADYTRYQRRERSAALAVMLGLCLSSAWLMAIGSRAARISGDADPTAMILGLGLPVVALVGIALSTVTTNFVNLYLSSLAVRSLWSGAPRAGTVVAVGVVGTALGLLDPELLDRYAGYMGILGTLLLPIVAVTLVHFFLPARRALSPTRVLRPRALLAWGAGALTYRIAPTMVPSLGATLPALVVTVLVYLAFRERSTIERPPGASAP